MKILCELRAAQSDQPVAHGERKRRSLEAEAVVASPASSSATSRRDEEGHLADADRGHRDHRVVIVDVVFAPIPLGLRPGLLQAIDCVFKAFGGGMTDRQKQWYIVHTYSGFEKKVKESLAQRVDALGMARGVRRDPDPDRGRSWR